MTGHAPELPNGNTRQQFSFWLVWEVRCPPFRVFQAAYDHPPSVPFVPFVP